MTGALVEVFQTGLQGIETIHATLVEAAPGRSAQLDELTVLQAEQWGRAIAELHEIGRTVSSNGLPTWSDALCLIAGDTQLRDATAAVLDRCIAALGPPTILAHGDPQVDNASWSLDGPVFFDLDDAAVSWAVTDLAMAVRDVQPLDQLDTPVTDTPMGQALLRGYRSVKDLHADQERMIPLVQRLSGAVTYGRLKAVLAAPHLRHESDWVRHLRTRLHGMADRLRRALTTGP